MRRFVFIAGLTFLVVLASGLRGDACGDKLLVLGRGVRFQVDTADYPSSLLLYINPNMPGADKVGDTQLQNITRQAGHPPAHGSKQGGTCGGFENGTIRYRYCRLRRRCWA